LRQTELIGDCLNANTAQLYTELWTSLASLLRSYTAVHGLSGNRQATFEVTEVRILASHGSRWLELERQGAIVTWKRADGSRGTMELTEAGTLRGETDEEEMDMAAEAWARELMR
jgi:hypothetical protein